MRNTIIAGLFAVATSAQTLVGSPAQPPTSLSQALANPITVVGCLHSDQRALSIRADTSVAPTGPSRTRSSPTGTPVPEAKTIL